VHIGIKNKHICKSTKCYEAYSKDNKEPCPLSQHLCPLNELKKSSKSTIKLIHSVNNRPLSINSARLNLNNQYCIIESIRDLSDNVNYSHQQKISSLGFLASSLAHEIKNNLGAINIILDGLISKYHNNKDDTSEETKYLSMISNQIKESIKIPERLLKLSQSTDNSSIINITNSITDILSLLDYEIKSKGIELIKHFSNGYTTPFK
jgi:nitrogen-specific signal transduction histidine kinase